jgi:hypothetical protein
MRSYVDDIGKQALRTVALNSSNAKCLFIRFGQFLDGDQCIFTAFVIVVPMQFLVVKVYLGNLGPGGWGYFHLRSFRGGLCPGVAGTAVYRMGWSLWARTLPTWIDVFYRRRAGAKRDWLGMVWAEKTAVDPKLPDATDRFRLGQPACLTTFSLGIFDIFGKQFADISCGPFDQRRIRQPNCRELRKLDHHAIRIDCRRQNARPFSV